MNIFDIFLRGHYFVWLFQTMVAQWRTKLAA